MEEDLICPNCGESNSPELPYCGHCQWRLRPLDESWERDGGQPAGWQSGEGGPGPAESELPVPDWLKDVGPRSATAATPTVPQPRRTAPEEMPPADDDLLAGLRKEAGTEGEEVPEWVARIMGLSKEGEPPDASFDRVRGGSDFSDDSPSRPGALPGRAAESPWASASPSGNEVFGNSEAMDHPDRATVEGGAGAENSQIFEWLRQLDATAVAGAESPTQPQADPTQDVPGWIDDMVGVPGSAPHDHRRQEDTLPGWLAEGTPTPEEGSEAGHRPRARESDAAGLAEPPKRTPEVVPPFAPDEMRRLDVDAVFASMEMPDWLAELGPGKPTASEESASTAPGDQPISPVALPSWIEAMRPMDTTVGAESRGVTAPPPEERGPLLGLQGVLPAIMAAAVRPSTPKVPTLKLEVSPQQRAHAQLMEEILAAEARPLPFTGMGRTASHRALRWFIGALLLALVSGTVLSRSSVFPLPAAVPNESIAAIQTVEALAPDAPVLAIFDYEPSAVGEMEASAASLLDHLLLLKHPRLALLSTSPTGSALAERMLSGILADRTYARGAQYVNLGFLAGGLAGVQSFAQDPAATVPIDASAQPAWDSGVLQGIRKLSDFAAIIVLTESYEGGRVWIEQTQGIRGSSALLIVTSAQAGPMLLPYFESGQAAGLVAGLNGAAGVELANSGLPGVVRKYWDAYSLGLYLAIVLITLGTIWYWLSGLRDRSAEAA